MPAEREQDQSALASHRHQAGDVEGTLEFLKRTRNELRTLRLVRVWTDRVQVYDVNGDHFDVQGIGYPDAEVVPILKAVHTAFNPELIHAPFDGDFKEFKTGRRHPWAEDRVM
jgi:hypothetical protein